MKKMKAIFASIGTVALPYVAHAQVTLTNPLGENDVRVIIGTIIKGYINSLS